ncbi:MAG: hypothetical protein CMM58_04090 [Rhodospirillaceae bacterium]|nr:hypothetical protein [Rhodospirillaceae bacterium]|tara:strand:+ start:1757 stop:2302 length:546 start_codon:yes stop_codon:yes gene_type:complete
MNILFGITKSPFGWIIAAETPQGICFVGLGKVKRFLVNELLNNFPSALLTQNDKKLESTILPLTEGFSERSLKQRIPLDLKGTPFQKTVWRSLIDIPPKTTLTYSELAAKIGTPRAYRAVGSACGKNPISLIIPCHRVLGSSGQLSGYRWGLNTKRSILDWEKTSSKLPLNSSWVSYNDFS